MYQQTENDFPVILVSVATQTEYAEPTVFENSVEIGTTPCTVADDMQTEEPFRVAVHQSPIHDVPIPAATVNEPWQAPPRRRVRRKRNIASTNDDDDDALLNAAIFSATQERSELANTVAHQVEQRQQEVRRVGLVCPRHPRRYGIVARAVLDATDTRCLRCNTLPARGEAWAGWAPCDFLFCGRCVSNNSGLGDLGSVHPCCAGGSGAHLAVHD